MSDVPPSALIITVAVALAVAGGALPAVMGQSGPGDGSTTTPTTTTATPTESCGENDCPTSTTRPTGRTTTTGTTETTTVTTQPENEDDSWGSGPHPCDELRSRYENRSGSSGASPSASERQRARELYEECRERHEAYQERRDEQAKRREEARGAYEERQDLAEYYRSKGLEGERGGFLANGTHVEGTFVAFDYDPAGTLLAYSVHGTTFLSQVTLPGPVLDVELHGHREGNRITFEGEGWKGEVTDQPTGTLMLVSEGGLPLAFHLAPGVNGTPPAGGSRAWHLDANGTRALLVAGAAPGAATTANGAAIQATGKAFFHVPAARAFLPAVANLNRLAIDGAVANATMGAELSIAGSAGTLDVERIDYLGMTLDVTEAANGTLSVLVDAELEGSRLLVVNVASGVLPQGNLTVRYYDVLAEGDVEVPIGEAASLAAILDVGGGGTLPGYWPVWDADGLQLLVYIPHFSAHKIVLQGSGVVELLQRPLVTWGVLGAVVLVSAAGLLALRPREEEEI